MIMHKRHILVVDDDPDIGELISHYLGRHGLRVSVAKGVTQAERCLRDAKVDCIILDIMMPGEDGVSFCQRLRRESEIPIIMLSAAAEEADRVIGLEVGADDYLSKPFGSRELLARVKALLRRSSGGLAEQRAQSQLARLPKLHFDRWCLDRNRQQLIADDGVVVPLSRGEYDLLMAFLTHPGRILTRDQLLDLSRGKQSDPLDRSIDVQIGRLRKKIEHQPKEPTLILTVRGGGYQLQTTVKVKDDDNT